jgi:hypothetical protein
MLSGAEFVFDALLLTPGVTSLAERILAERFSASSCDSKGSTLSSSTFGARKYLILPLSPEKVYSNTTGALRVSNKRIVGPRPDAFVNTFKSLRLNVIFNGSFTSKNT